MRPLACGECARNTPDPQLLQCPLDLRVLFLRRQMLVVVQRPVHLKQARLVGAELHRTPVPVQVVPQQAHVLRRGIARRKPRRQLAAGVVDHGDQAHLLLAPPLQPIVIAGIPLHQFATPLAPRTPHMHAVAQPLLARLPQPGLAHPLPQRFPVHFQLVIAFQHLGRLRRAVVGVAFGDHLKRPPPRPGSVPAVGRLPSQPVRQAAIALLPHPLYQFLHPARAHAQLLGRLALRQLPRLYLPQHHQPVPFLPAQSHNLVHLPSLPAFKANFLLCLTRGTSQIEATVCLRFADSK